VRAIVLSAGQGRRLLPLTAKQPKCLLHVDEHRSVLELQLAALARCGIERATVVTGFESPQVESRIGLTPTPGLRVDALYNPFYAVSDNLATCWLARHLLDDDCLLLNGDTLFEDEVLLRVLRTASAPITVTVDHKSAYDADDMKVVMDPDGRLRAIGKTLEAAQVNGESIGLLCLRGTGPGIFREALEATMQSPAALGAWYLSVIDDVAKQGSVGTVSVRGLWWREIDSLEDLEEVRRSLPRQLEERALPLSAVAGV
jgi:choline kinase